MRGHPVAKSVGEYGFAPNFGGRHVVLIAPGRVRILRAAPPARVGDVASIGVDPRPADPGRLQAPSRCSGWAMAAEGLSPGLYYLH